MKRKLIIHVGMGKTGSSSIQKTLRLSQKVLLSKGIQYLGLMLEHSFSTTRFPWQKVDGWPKLNHLEPEAAQSQLAQALLDANTSVPDNVHTLVWSNESLFLTGSFIHDAITEISSHFDISIIGYIRRPDAWITSAYLQWGIKHKTYKGALLPFRQWVQRMPYKVMQGINTWSAHGNIEPNFFNFDAVHDITSHFVNICFPELALDIPIERENDTPPPIAMALFAQYNSLHEEQVLPSVLEPLLKHSGIMNKAPSSRAYNNLLPQEIDIRQYVESNSNELNMINAYFDRHDEPRFDLTNLKVKDYSANQHEVNRALLQMIKHLSDEVESLKQRLNKGNNND